MLKKFLFFNIIAWLLFTGSPSSSLDGSTTILNNCASLKGNWKGIYKYDLNIIYFSMSMSGEEIHETPFTLIIDEVNKNSFKGKIIEPGANWGPKDLNEFEAKVSGKCSEKGISFTKTYTFKNGHSINYNGSFTGNDELKGKWKISNGSGDWEAKKINNDSK